MCPENRVPTHPGVVLRGEFLGPLGVTRGQLARHLGVPIQRINELVNGKRGVTSETAGLLAQAFRTTPEPWANLQVAHDLARHRSERRVEPLEPARVADVASGAVRERGCCPRVVAPTRHTHVSSVDRLRPRESAPLIQRRGRHPRTAMYIDTIV
jgi:addiction module HigA family antidote